MVIKTNEYIIQKWLVQLNVKNSTLTTYERIINNQILPFWNRKRKFRKAIKYVNKYYDWLYEKPLNYKYLSDVIIVFNSILEFALENRYIKRKIKLNYKGYVKQVVDIFTINEQNKIIYSILNKPSHLYIGILISICLGVRIGEVCALQVKDINFESRKLSISNTVQRVKNFNDTIPSKTVLEITTPKTINSIREIPISDSLFEMLKLLFYDTESENYLLTNNVNFIEPRSYENIYKRFLKKLDIKEKKYHVLRHTFATMSLEVGVDIKVVSEILGHANVQTTYNLYIHLSNTFKSSELAKLDNFYKNLLCNLSIS